MVKIERSQFAPPSLKIEKEKGTKNYRSEDVIMQLNRDFHGKCYLCEISQLQSVEVEHLRSHHNGRDRERMFDWNNLFYSCAHCNGVKNKKKYEDCILDCCQVEPEEYISQELKNGRVQVTALKESREAHMTAELITECFEQRNTGIRILECQVRVDALQETMAVLYRSLRAYKNKPTPRNLRTLQGLLNRDHRFAGFTRTYVRKHIKEYPDLSREVSLE
ncbi:MAG TPA: hypothetical protein IAA04_03460 [Candidatus Lachnoclostridium pullistercoris]|uniref:TIGR02646 family protein n=1 Tax=Candidatus Lachnoclostridium pullistercoris TaxID=2838632 RepID=A0A9D2PCG4_9FIRM|nr:hypothetical protein [Candidatus Lachnoclostridium pullistercoris]